MPAVEVLYKHGSMEENVADAVKATVRRIGSRRFSTTDLQLSENDFSFKFYEPTKYDELTHGIIVRIRMQDNAFRRSQSPDIMAGQMAGAIHEAIASLFIDGRQPTVGVELNLTEIGWNTAGSSSDGVED